MAITKINDNLYHVKFTQFFNTNGAVVVTRRRLFVVDTHLGPDSMAEVIKLVKRLEKGRHVYLVNTHHHFDHIWGNCAFPDVSIIAQEECLEIMKKEGIKTLEESRKKNPEMILGNVRIVYPDIVFSGSLRFHDDDEDIVFYHLPGHSEDSVVIFLEKNRICLAGDTVEDPLPLVSESTTASNIDLFIESLISIKNREPLLVLPGHGDRLDPGLVDDNLSYLEAVKEAVLKTPETESSLESFIHGASESGDFYIDSHRSNLEKAREFLRSKMG